MSRMITCALTLSLVCTSAFAGTLPGTQINASSRIAGSIFGAPVNAKAALNYNDSAGVPGPQQISNTIAVTTTISLPVQQGNEVNTFVAPPDDAKTYFTIARSFYGGASLVGQKVKLAGKVESINGGLYINDGSMFLIKGTNGAKNTTESLPVKLRTDLLNVIPSAGSIITIEGVVREEADGQPSLLPFTDDALTAMQ